MFGLWGASRYYRLIPRALSPSARLGAREAILDSPYMSTNNLNYRFAGTYGFSIVFSRAGRAEVGASFPAFEPFLEQVLEPRCNAFFLNPLLIVDGTGVAPHIDLSLRSYAPEVGPPKRVSVWYLSVPSAMVGGELKLYREQALVATVVPREGAILSFRGDLRHEVSPVSTGAPTIYDARLSLVVEQYRLSPALLASLPPCTVGSRRTDPNAPVPLAGGVGDGVFGELLRNALTDDSR